ncbi:histidine ammonia-lyase [bacterium]|nr:MAG: histidine ammonia-lyase [bacterium]
MSVILDGKHLSIEDVVAVARRGEKVEVSNEAWERIKKCRAMLDEKVEKEEVMYGVTTGIGELSEVVLKPEQVKKFQRYLIYSHAAGYGEPMAIDDARGAILSRINVLCNGLSGIRPEVVQLMVELLNRGVTPIMFQHGSVGACGDLSPMSQFALVLMGEGEVFYQGERLPAAEGLKRAGLEPVEFLARDGLACINGSNCITSMGTLQLYDIDRLIKNSEIAAAMTLEVLNAQMKSYDERLHKARGYPGAVECASNIRRITEGSEMLYTDVLGKKKVQDSYSLRSTPQVVGAAKDALKWAKEQFLIELNGVGDNPLFFPDDNVVIPGANFQGTPLAFPLELMGTAITTIGVLSERRTNRLMNRHLSAGLPPFLTKGAGMMSGLMLIQYTAGMLIAECRVLSHPAATLSVPAAADQEDFVSMGMTTAIKTKKIIEHISAVIGIEMMAAAQAIDFRKPHKPGKGTQAAYEAIREKIPFLDEDRPTCYDNNTMAEMVRAGKILDAVESVVGKLD